MGNEQIKVIIDSNFFLTSYKYNLDIFGEVGYLVGNRKFTISRGVINELKSISKRKGKSGLEARFGLKLIDNNIDKIEIVESVKSVDDWVVEYAEKYNAIVCTIDNGLKNRLKAKELKVIMIKSRSKVDFV